MLLLRLVQVCYCFCSKLLSTFMQQQFNLKEITEKVEASNKILFEQGEVPFDPICEAMQKFTLIFPLLNSFLGVAFKDVTQKVTIIRDHTKQFPGHAGFFSFIKMEMEKKIHVLNGDNNSKYKAPPQFKNYTSTARNLLRLMWFLTFLKVTFEEFKLKPNEKFSTILTTAYDAAFGQKHAWLVKKGAKVAMMTAPDRSRLPEVVMGNKDEKLFIEATDRFLKAALPSYELMWKFYKEKGLVDLQ